MASEAQARVIEEWKAAVVASGERAPKEWIGKTPDSKIPDTVINRVFRMFKGTCYLSGRKIRQQAWQVEHVIPLHAQGEHREANLRPVLIDPHKEKSKAEQKRKAKADAVAKKHNGVTKPKGNIKSPGFPEVAKEAKGPPSKVFQGLSEIARRYGVKE